MVEIVVPETEKPVLEIRTAVDERHDEQSQKFGLSVIQDGEQEPSPDDASNHETPVVPFDVVLIHGIYGSSPDSWTTGSDSIWINKALAGASENKGRVMSYGYHADIETGRYFTPCGVYQEAEELLEALRKLWTSEITGAKRPIHFFAHDVGGTIVKAALAIASDDQDKYADILYCTRAMYFFGYPHRYSSIGLLEEAVLRLMAQQQQKWSGHMVGYAKSLTETIIKVNDAFLGTQMLTQANFINVVSNLHLDPAQQVFPLSMSTMATPFERVVKMEKSNCDLILAGEDRFHPVNDIADADWLMGGFTDEQHIALRTIINQASPVQPYRRIDEEWKNSDLLELPRRKETLIIHMRCSSGAEAASENASFFLDNNRSGTFHPLLYMKFYAHDTRFNNCDAMMRTFLARILCNRLQTESVASRSMDDLIRSGALHRTNLSEELETLRSAKGKQKLNRSAHRADFSTDMKSAIYVLGCFDECDESSIWFLSAMHKLLLRKEQRIKILVVTTKGTHGDCLIASALSEFPSEYVRNIDYHPEEHRPFPVNTEASRLTNELGECVGTCVHRNVHRIISSCADDHDLCELVLGWLRTGSSEQIARTERLLEKPFTPTIAFAAILEDVEESYRPWAKILLSWLLACYRPLRYDELRQVSNIVWLQLEGGKTLVSAPTDILRSFQGLLTSVNGEIQFKHPDTRAWLDSCHTADDEDIWYDIIETGRHEKVLQTCIDYIQHAARSSQGSVLSLPYAIEFWHKHWQRVKTSEKHVQDLFCNESVFQFWANSLFTLPNVQFKPTPSHLQPLAVAAHLGLTKVVEGLLGRNQDQTELRGQALVEACRIGHVATIKLLLRSYTDGLDFDDEHLHEAARVASHSSNDEALEELISAIPEPPKPNPVVEESEMSLDFTESQEKTASQGDSSERSTKHDLEDKALDPQKRVSSPLDWLVMPMYRATRSGMNGAVTRLLQLGISPNPPKGITPYGNSYMHAAAVNNHVASAKLLIDAGASPTTADDQGYTPLQKAIWWASGETVEFLLSNGASINDLDQDNCTTLGASAMWGSFGAVEAILSRKDEAGRMAHDSDWHPVIQAVEYENKKCLELLLGQGFSPNIVSLKGETALRLAIQNKRLDFCKMLLESNADPNLTPDKANTPLIQAISVGDLDIVKLLIENKATVDKREAPPDDGWSRTPMQVAVDWNRPEIVQYLLEKGADPDAQDSDGIPAIGAAVSGGHINMVQWLVDAKADVNVIYHESKLTLLHEACPHPEIFRLLLEHGADINKANADSRTALNFAIVTNNPATVEVLLEAKTKPDINTDTIYMDLRMVIASGYIDIVEKMLEASVDVDNVNEKGESLLAYAIRYNAPSGMIRKILEYNPDLEMRDKKESTALHCITRLTTLETVRLVVNAGGRLDVLNADKDTPLIVAIGAQMDDVFFYMLKKEPSLLTQNFITSQQRATPLHEACRFGSLAMVRSLIDHGMDVNLPCEGVYGTTLISATLRSDLLSSPLASDIIALLLVNGASPSTEGGLFQYPLISACLSCPADTVKLLLNSDTSPKDYDSLNRKAVHMACYNSLAVLNLLEAPDSDFKYTDMVGRVPLHYAVMTGDVELVEVVLKRSERVRISIDVKDDDGWTPLLWAARAARIWNRQIESGCSSSDMILFLLKHGADPTIKGHGVDRDWTVCEVAYYHHADFVEDLIDQPSNEKIRSRKRGSAPGSRDNKNAYCDNCLIESHGIFFDCSLCYDFSLCFKCYRNADKTHPEHSSFVRCGSEWVEDEVAKDEDVQEISLDGGVGEQDVLLDLEEIPYEDFDSEVSE
ncbi:hypothetical protein H9Q73_003087 [Fusarium xylarioides]|nr:hypothetical protein H9Q73_003087 [Fusarium xylarioides]